MQVVKILLFSSFACLLACPAPSFAGPAETVIQRAKTKVNTERSKGRTAIAGVKSERLMNNFHGTDPETRRETLQEDEETLTGNDTKKCNKDYGHTWDSFLTPPSIQPGFCQVYYKYQGPGRPIGSCWKCIQTPYCCFCIKADLIEYLFPSHKVDISEQPGQSLYITESEYASYLSDNIRNFDRLAPRESVNTINQVASEVAEETGAQGVTNAGRGQVRQAREAVDAINAFRQTVLGEHDVDVRLSAPDRSEVYSRNIVEPLNYDGPPVADSGRLNESGREHHMDNNRTWVHVHDRRRHGHWKYPDISWGRGAGRLWYIPHIAKYHMFGTDMPMRGGFLYSKILSMSASIDRARFRSFFAGGWGACVKRNVATGKTPTWIGVFGGIEDESLCMQKIGPIFPYTEHGLQEITDRTFQAAVKGHNLFDLVYDDPGPYGPGTQFAAERHSYLADKDLWLVLNKGGDRNPAFKSENTQCTTIDKMAKLNYTYRNSNSKLPFTGGENTFEVYTRFKGCWGWQGADESFWTNRWCAGLPGIWEHGPASTKLGAEATAKTRLH